MNPEPPVAETSLDLVIHGAAGRMGQRLVALASANPTFRLVAAVESTESSQLGQDAGTIAGVGPIGVPLTDEIPQLADVVIDFSLPEASVEAAAACSAHGIPLVMATTGQTSAQLEYIHAFSHKIALLLAPNMSLAVNLVMKLGGITAGVLRDYPGGVDVEILERHHRFKEDAPSGTALKFGHMVAEAMGQTTHTHGRSGRIGKRSAEEIGYHAIRTGDNPGEHTIIFGMLGETIELTVRASNRDSYAAGALTAAKWLVGKGAGLYSMNDVLGL